MRQTSRWYSNLSHSLSKTVTPTRAMVLTIHDLSIFLGTSTTWCGFCDPQMIRLWRFTFPDKWKVASSLKTILSKNKLSSWRQFSISVQKFLRCGRSLGFNSCSSWNLYSRKNNLLHREITPSSVLDPHTWTKQSRKMERLWQLHSMVTQITQSDTHELFILGIRER
jgi:hypothetical protein